MSIIASDLVPAETLASKDELWAPQAIFLPEWSAGVVLSTSWTTNIAAGDTAAETRTGVAMKPSRSIEFTVSALGVAEIALLRSVMNRGSMARTPVPLFCDSSALDADAAAGSTTISCDTADRRFFAGGRVVIIDMPATTVATSFEFAVVDSVASDAITLTAATTADHLAHSLVFPVLEADLVPQLSAGAVTDDKATVRVVYRETVGAMTLDPLVTPGDVAAGYATFSTTGLPIFTPPLGPDWSKGPVQIGVTRLNETTKSGLFNYIQTHGSRPAGTMTLPFTMLDRSSFASAAGFFDSRAGRQKSFVAMSPTSDFVLMTQPAGGDATIELQAVGAHLDWTWRTMLGLELADGTVVVVQVASVARGDTDVVTIGGVLPTLATPVMKVSNAYLMRFDSDEISESWMTDRAVSFSLNAVELIAEATITIPNLGGTIPLATVTVDVIDDSVQSFGSFPAGIYRITYISGAMDYGGQGYRIQYPTTLGQYVVYNNGAAEIQGPGDGDTYSVGLDCQNANVGAYITINHTGGTIGMYTKDTPGAYFNNVIATDVGAPTFELSR